MDGGLSEGARVGKPAAGRRGAAGPGPGLPADRAVHHLRREPSEQARTAFRELVRRRAEGTPVAYLVGRREFYSLSFRVTPDVLIPRPETELLVVAVLDLAKTNSPDSASGRGAGGEGRHCTIADVGTGSGIIAVCLAKHLPTARVTAIDISPAALAVARGNAEEHGVADRIEFLKSDLFAAVPAAAAIRLHRQQSAVRHHGRDWTSWPPTCGSTSRGWPCWPARKARK